MPTIFEFINTTLGVQVPQELTGIGIGNLVAYALAACILFGFGTVLGVDIALFASGLTIMFLNLWMGHVTIVDSTVSSMLYIKILHIFLYAPELLSFAYAAVLIYALYKLIMILRNK